MLFINTSKRKSGNTNAMAKILLNDLPYDQINMIDYQINQVGQTFPTDQFGQILDQIITNDTLIWGTPVYWHDMSATLKTLIERLSASDQVEKLRGKKLYLILQGSDPTDALQPVTHVIQRFCDVFEMQFVGVATSDQEARQLHKQLLNGK
ncbi:flavodoxin family protein [Loigolactobacillus iwatensis]|uniref:flavodoxin family protein n=1 Tax=Loigolactobacillus iwatensis TaxID=1267156 RepID=UPI000F7E3FC6|nr:NAD(P)H-dependent oxidoreductase [Loigolactobacillus iwatensis]